MEALQSVLAAIQADPWVAMACVTLYLLLSRTFAFYKLTIQERGPGQRRIRQNLERERPKLRERYYYVLLSLRRTIDDRFGPSGSRTANINSFDFFLKVSAIYCFGSLLFVYLLSGMAPTVFRVFGDNLSSQERAVLATCFVLGLAFAATIYRERRSDFMAVPAATFFALMPFVIASQFGLILGFDIHSNSFTYWVFVILYLGFVGQACAAVDESGFVAVVVLIAMVFSLVLQFALMGVIIVWLDINMEMFKPNSWPPPKYWVFSFSMLAVFAGTSAFPFLIKRGGALCEKNMVQRIGKVKFYAGFVCLGIAIFIMVSASKVGHGLIGLLLYATVMLPLLSVMLDWTAFRAADRMLSISVNNGGGYVILSVAVAMLVAMIGSAVFVSLFILAAAVVAAALPRIDGFTFVDLKLTAELLVSAPYDGRLWWLYCLLCFNLIPVVTILAAGIFGFLSWQTPRALADRYVGFIKKGFKGDHPRLVETSTFLTARLVLSLTLSVVSVALALLGLRWLFPNVVAWFGGASAVLAEYLAQ